MEGFFSTLELGLIKRPPSLIPQCGLCRLYKSCLSPKMKVSGKGRRGVLIAGEAPGEQEDYRGKQFVGKTGQHLEQTLRKLGVDMRNDCWLTNVVICRPKANKLPAKAIEYCRPNLIKAIEDLKPNVVIILGAAAVKSIIPHIWKEDAGSKGTGMRKWAGWQIPCRKPNMWVCPTWHPSYCIRELDKGNAVPQMYFAKDLEQAFSHEGRPWSNNEPNLTSHIITELNPDNACIVINEICKAKQSIAWDLETDRLKPDHPKAKIICCALSNGKTTISYPWMGSAVKRTEELLASDVPKIGWNIQFEHRWLLAQGIEVKNWIWDGMVNTHILDNRSGITSLKFQAFVQLGVGDYDSAVKPYFRSKIKRGNVRNKIMQFVKDQGWKPLLTYCGMDALLEWKIGTMQMAKLKMLGGVNEQTGEYG